MDKMEFGTLVSLLRQDLGLTQFQLHERSGVNLAVISQIERGARMHLDPQLLIKLANALHLTTIERREFFLAASGVAQQYLIRQPSAALATDTVDIVKVLSKMTKLIERLSVPAFIMDVYSDVLAVNNMAFAFFQTPLEMIQKAASTPGGFTTVRVMFGKELSVKSKITENWEQYAVGSMRFVRENSLRYRARPYFQYLMKAFRDPNEYPLFERYWKMVSSTEQDREANTDEFSYTHADFGRITYATATTTSITPHGELFLNQYLPLDEHTRGIFADLERNVGLGVLAPLAPWPKKEFP